MFKFFWIVLIHGKENVKLENNRIREACKEIIKYYCCNWYGFILGPFHYLTKKKKKIDLQIAISKKIHRFLVLRDKMLRKSNQMKKLFSIIVAIIGMA